MAEQTVEVGNTIILIGINDPFSDEHMTGYREFYGERYRPTFLLISHMIHDYLMTIWNEPSMPSLWKAGRIVGWMEALLENLPQTLRSFPLEGEITVLQKA